MTPILYDFYNYDVDKAEFAQLFVKFTQVSNYNLFLTFNLNCTKPESLNTRINCCSFAEFSSSRGTSLFHRNEEFIAEEDTQEKGGCQKQD